MTGRRLYDLVCDELARKPEWLRQQIEMPTTPKAWPFLTQTERQVYNAVARRLPKGRATRG